MPDEFAAGAVRRCPSTAWCGWCGRTRRAGVAATRTVNAIWRKAGQDAETDPREPNVPARQAIAHAALSGPAMGAARVLVTRKAAAYHQTSAGHLPAALAPTVEKA
jgi:hypothetical protein